MTATRAHRRPFARFALLVAILATSACSSGASIASETTTRADGSCVEATDGTIAIRTESFDYDPDCVTLAGDRLEVTYTNDERGVLHNFRLKGAVAEGPAATKLKSGPDTQSVTYVKLEAGTYTFICDIHPNMVGQVVVTGGD